MNTPRRFPRVLATACLAAGFLLSACGGGGGGGGGTISAAPAAADTTVGPISGFGSIIVNGIRFEDNAARVVDDSGSGISSSSLRLGMTVEVRGSVGDDGTGVANSISLFSELQGPVSGLDAGAGTFSILGFAIVTDGATVFEDIPGLSALADGDIVEVYGLRSGNTITASRIEKKTPNAGNTLIKLRGQISGLNTATTTFTLGSATVNYGTAQVTPNLGSLVDGAFVKVRSTTAPSGSNVTASRVQVVGNSPFDFDEGGKSEIEGVVSAFSSLASFQIAGVPVDASGASTVFLRGSAAAIGDGVRLEAEGVFTNGVLVARKIKFEDDDGEDEFELHGTVSNFASLASFQVRGVQVDASGAGVLFERGTAADVANGRLLEVEGSVQGGSAGSILIATKVKFEDVSGSGSNSGSGSGSGASDDNSGSGSGNSSRDDSEDFEFKGTVTSVAGNTLVVGSRTVTIDSGTVFRRMSQSQVVVGAFLEVKGVLQGDGSVRATRISLED